MIDVSIIHLGVVMDLFTDTVAILKLIRFKEYYRMPRGHEHICIFERFSGHFVLKFSLNKIVMGKKILVPCFDVIMIAFF